MFALMKREIWDHAVYFIAAGFLAICFVLLVVFGEQVNWREDAVGLAIPVFVLLFIGSAILGASQMYSDRAARVSTLLSTLAVTRPRIFIARIAIGVLAILTCILPMIVASIVMVQYSSLPLHLVSGFIADVSITLFLAALGCYGIGLQLGWTTNKLMLLVAPVILSPLFFTFVVIKGFYLQAMGFLLLFDCLCLARVYFKFRLTPL